MAGQEIDARKAAERALALIMEALDLLDASGACPDAAAHLDLASRRLRGDLAGGAAEPDPE